MTENRAPLGRHEEHRSKRAFLALGAVAALLASCIGVAFLAFTSLKPQSDLTVTQGTAAIPSTAVPAAAPGAPADQGPPAAAAEAKAESSKPAVEVMAAKVVRVVDGDTAVFAFESGVREKVRFIGIDTPESTKEIEPYGEEASAYTADYLPVGATVFLEEDVDRRDKYGRLLAYVWVARPNDASESEVRAKMLNARLALDGYAQQMTIQPNCKYAEYFTAFVREAREAERGLWDPAFAPKPQPKSQVQKPSGGSGSASYIGNSNTRKFHYPSCTSVPTISPSHVVNLGSRSEAISAGYAPCGRCDP
jgi:micrococcal nuclease